MKESIRVSGSYLIDTSVVVAALRNDPAVKRRLRPPARFFLPVIAIGELYHGALSSTQAEVNVHIVDDFAADFRVLPCDGDTARRYGLIKNQLRIKGRPIPDNDIWIAAIALQYSLTLASRDRHYSVIQGLAFEMW